MRATVLLNKCDTTGRGDKMEREAMFYRKTDGKKVECSLCPHNCTIQDGKYGICNVRQNVDGVLYTRAYGNPVALHVDPIEKKPLYHFLPGSLAYSIATMGCNFKCGFCQNWQISQIEDAEKNRSPDSLLMPREIVEEAEKHKCKSIAYTYTEPTIFFEYAYDTSVPAHKRGLKNIFVTNGYISKEPLKEIAPYLDAANVDLKSFRDEYYKKICKARLQPVLDTISLMNELGIWLEVTTLFVPGENDAEKEMHDIAEFIAGVSREIPWHISRFYPQYNYSDASPTPVETLHRAEKIGREHGIRHIHLGNV